MQRTDNTNPPSALSQPRGKVPMCCACLGAVTLCLVLDGCGGSTDPKQIQDPLDSWSRTIDLAMEQWHQHRLPDLYLEQILHAATNEKKKDEQQIGKLDRVGAQSLGPHEHVLATKIAIAAGELARARQKTP